MLSRAGSLKLKKQAKVFIELAEKLGQTLWVRELAHCSLSYLERIAGHPGAALRELDKAWTSAVTEDDFGASKRGLAQPG